MVSGLDPEKALYVYPESMARQLLNAALMRAELPPRWVIELLDSLAGALAGALGGNKKGKRNDKRDG